MRDKRKYSSFQVFSPASVAYVIQIASVYLFAFLHKIPGRDWFIYGTTIEHTLKQTVLTTAFGSLLSHLPPLLLQLVTYFVVWLEGLGALYLFFPFFNQKFRTVIIGLYVSMHIMFFLCLRIGLFPFIDIVALFGLLPAFFWELLPKVFHRSQVIKKIVQNEKKSLKAFRKSLTPKSPTFLPIFSAICIYALVLFVLAWNISGFKKFPYKLPPILINGGYMLGIHQDWRMFAPFPPRYNITYLTVGLQNEKKTYILPYQSPQVTDMIDIRQIRLPSEYVRKYYEHMIDSAVAKSYYAKYVCRLWGNQQNRKVMIDEILTSIENPNIVITKTIGTYSCM